MIDELLGQSDSNLKEIVNKRYWELEKVTELLRKERDQARNDCFIKEQIIEELKHQESITIEQYEEQIVELKENLERKEYGIQYKE